MPTSPRSLDAFLADTPDRIFITDLEGRILERSQALARELSLTGEAGLLELAHKDDHGRLVAAWSEFRAGRDAATLTGRLRAGEHGYRLYAIEARRAPGSGEVCGSIRPLPADEIPYASRILRVMFEHLPLMVWAHDKNGVYTLQEGKSLASMGLKPGQFVGQSAFDVYGQSSEGADVLRRVIGGELIHNTSDIGGCITENFFLPVRDARGEAEMVLGVALDITASKQVERELAAKLKAIEDQKQIIRSLATPIIQVWSGVLTMPLVGVVDSVRAAEVMDSLLSEVARTRARFAVLDVTGVDVMDTATAGHLLRLIRSLRLLGAEGIITGIRPTIAQTMASIGLEMASVTTLRDLRQGLQYCIERLEAEGADQRGADREA